MDINKEYQERKEIIKSRLDDFSRVKNDGIFYEMCFCLLTPQSSAKQADKCIQVLKKLDFKNKNINPEGFLEGIRFHINKSKYLIEAKQKFSLIESKLKEIKNSRELRDWLVQNIKGYGYKEASHFLRNIGHRDLAILDRHILKNLHKMNVIEEVPKSLAVKKYFEIENKFKEFSKQVNIPIDELELLFWSHET